MVVDSNLRLVISIARKYHHHRLSLLDIVQEGNIGLMKAVECFDSRLGFHFSTYATWWITHAIRRAISDTGDTIRLPTHLREKLAKVRDYFDTHPGAEKRRDPEEIAAAVGMTVADARHALEADMLVYIDSLDRPMGYEPDSHSLMSQVEDAGSPRADAQVIEVDFVRRVREVVNSALDPREQRVIQLRFGEDDDVTLNEVGGMLGVTRERIRQIQEKALGKGGRALMRQLDPCIRDYGSLMGK
jgi:RNA polymerase primary sigma factor